MDNREAIERCGVLERNAIKELQDNIDLPFGVTVSEDASKLAIVAIEGLAQYRELGTFEQVREAVERMKPKKVVTTNGFCIGKTKDGEEIYRVVESCPTCGLTGLTNLSKAGWKNYYCPRCGQCIDCE